jgi:hypothetical protein
VYLRVITSPYSISGLVFVTKIECAYRTVQTEWFNIIQVNLSFNIVLYQLSCHSNRISDKQTEFDCTKYNSLHLKHNVGIVMQYRSKMVNGMAER